MERADLPSTRAEGPIAYVMTHYPRVAMTFIADEIGELEARGVDIVPIAMNRPGPNDLESADARTSAARTFYLKSAGALALIGAWARQIRRHPGGSLRLLVRALRSARFDGRVALRRLAHLLYAASVVEHCRARGVRHLHAQFGLAPATIAWFATELGNLDPSERWTWSFTIHGFHDFVNETDARLDLKAQSAEFVVCISDFTRSQLMRVSPPEVWSRAHVVRCGIHLDQFALRTEPARHTPALAGQPGPTVPTVIVVARLSAEKGHLVLIEALDVLRRRGRPVRVVLVGSGPLEDTIRQAATRLGVEDLVEFLGELEPEAVAKELASAQIFCLPSFSEGLPVSIIEAMAVGLPVVTTTIGGIPELAVDGETALTVAPGNAEALASAIDRLASQPELAARLTDAARAAVEARHDIHHNVAQLHALLKEVRR